MSRGPKVTNPHITRHRTGIGDYWRIDYKGEPKGFVQVNRDQLDGRRRVKDYLLLDTNEVRIMTSNARTIPDAAHELVKHVEGWPEPITDLMAALKASLAAASS